MKTMKNFAAQQLSKRQMNEVKGGRIRTAVLKNPYRLKSRMVL